MRISVKGTREQALAEMQARGIVGEFVCVGGNFGYMTIWEVPEIERSKVIEWFLDHGVCPPGGYHGGTLFWHN